jgi:hypothetical protein
LRVGFFVLTVMVASLIGLHGCVYSRPDETRLIIAIAFPKGDVVGKDDRRTGFPARRMFRCTTATDYGFIVSKWLWRAPGGASDTRAGPSGPAANTFRFPRVSGRARAARHPARMAPGAKAGPQRMALRKSTLCTLRTGAAAAGLEAASARAIGELSSQPPLGGSDGNG